jgi:2-C-methyl-D-erythritol 4-phosphate cytidylyltransferase
MHLASHMAAAGSPPETDVVVVAAGTGERLGRGTKALVWLAGHPLLAWALQSVLTNTCVRDIIVVAGPQAIAETTAVLTQAGYADRVRVVAGGATRGDSSALGLAALREGSRHVAVTDGVRPLAPRGWIDQFSEHLAVAGQSGFSAIVPAIPLFDTIRRSSPDGTSLGTIDRSELRAVQTPQLFCRQCLEEALALTADSGVEFTDEAGLIEYWGGKVLITAGDPVNRKITVEHDLVVAEALLAATGHSPPRFARRNPASSRKFSP